MGFKLLKKQNKIRPSYLMFLITALFFTLGTLVQAEINTDLMQQLLKDNDTDKIAEIGEQLNNNPEFLEKIKTTAPTPPTPKPTQGRKDKSKGAGAAAMIGAAMGFASCAMMMAAAAKMPPGPQRMQTMAKAMQQCGQAAKSLASGKKNNDGAKKLTSTPAKLPKVANNNQKTPQLKKKKDSGLKLPTSQQQAEDVADASVIAPEDFGADITVPDLGEGVDFNADLGLGTPGEGEDLDFDLNFDSVEAVTELKPIDNKALKFDEESDGSVKQTGGGSPGSFHASSNSSTLAGGQLKIAVEESASGVIKRGTASVGGGGAGSSGGTGDLSGVGGGGDDFDLSSLFGGDTPAGGGGFALSAGQDVLDLGGAASGSRQVNIFEYATLRYRKATYEESLVKPTKSYKSGPQM